MHPRTLSLLPLCILVLGLAAGEAVDPPEEAQARRVESAGFVGALKAWCRAKNAKVVEHGTGQFRLLSGGGASVANADALLSLGEQALKGLDLWTGGQGIFLPGKVEDATANYLVVVDDKVFDGFIKDLRAKGALAQPEGDVDLTMKLRSLSGARFAMLTEKKFKSHPVMPEHWAVRLSCNMALFAFFASWKSRPEPWISEGLGSEMERLLCKEKLPLITSIAYEENNPDTRSTRSWAQDVATLLRDRTELMTVRNILGLDLIGLSGNNYKQMWSACQFIRTSCGQTRGEQNRFYQILLKVAQGSTGYDAVCEVLGKEDPALSRAWAAWALRQK